MVDAGDVADMLDMVGDKRQRDRWFGVGRVPRFHPFIELGLAE